MQITVLGDGAWGTALAILLQQNGHRVCLRGAFQTNVEAMQRDHENRAFLPGVGLPPELAITGDMAVAMREHAPQAVVLAAPIQYLAALLEEVAAVPVSRPQPLFVGVAKGLQLETCRRPSEMVAQYLGSVPFCALSGPSHAEEVARQMPTAVVAAASVMSVVEQTRDLFINDYFRVYTASDLIGVELGGALKNVYAIAAGIGDGLELGDNAKAALLTRAIAEMARLGLALGGEAETFSGLSGVGDLMVTCFSRHSRNRRVGEELGRGHALEDIVSRMNQTVAEGVKTTLSVRQLVRARKVEAPIVEEVYQVLYNHKDRSQAVRDLMTREPKAETE